MVWKELGEALGELAGRQVGERVNMVSAALSTSSLTRASSRPWMDRWEREKGYVWVVVVAEDAGAEPKVKSVEDGSPRQHAGR